MKAKGKRTTVVWCSRPRENSAPSIARHTHCAKAAPVRDVLRHMRNNVVLVGPERDSSAAANRRFEQVQCPHHVRFNEILANPVESYRELAYLIAAVSS